MDRYINSGAYFIDNFCGQHPWFDQLAINDYHLLCLVWNLLLILVPFVLFRLLKNLWLKTRYIKPHQKILALALGLVWLLFLPNSVYIISDIRIISGYCPVDAVDRVCVANAWMIPIFFFYASLGWISFVYLLGKMSALIKSIFSGYIAKLFVNAAIPVISLGVLLGLVNRWNSWDVFYSPVEIIKTSLVYFSKANYFIDWLAFTILLYVLYYLGRLLFRKDIWTI